MKLGTGVRNGATCVKESVVRGLDTEDCSPQRGLVGPRRACPGTDTFTYDHENRMTSATVGSTSISNTYDGDGLRQSLTVGANTTNYTWDVARGLPVVLQDGNYTYVYGLDLISQTDSSSNQVYYSYDGLGSVTNVTNGSGAQLASYGYKAFGDTRASTGSSEGKPWLFTGEQQDAASGLYYLRARFYDPSIGRFVTQDPLPGMAGLPLTQNRYPYVGSNPINLRDPRGLCFG